MIGCDSPELFRSPLNSTPVSRDETPGSDSWAVHQGWVSVTPLGLKGDIAIKQQVN